jgi:membrane protein
VPQRWGGAGRGIAAEPTGTPDGGRRRWSSSAGGGRGPLPRLDLRAFRRWETTFPGRCVGTFIAMQGIDRAMALAAQTLTALIPLLLVASAVAPSDRRDLVSGVIIRKFQLAGAGAQAVQQVFARPGDSTVGVLSLVLLVFSGVSLTRRMQRMYLQAWRVEPIPGVRGSLNAAVGLTALLFETALLSFAHTLVRNLPFDWALGGPVVLLASLVLWASVPWLLLDRRIRWRRLLPGGALTAVGASIYGVATTIYMPRVMQSNSERYGLFGVTLSLVGWLLCMAFIVVAATVVAAEFDRAQERWACHLRARTGLTPAARPAGVREPPDRPAVAPSGDGNRGGPDDRRP